MKQRLVETGKNILIALLICSLLLLSFTALPSQSIRSLPWLSRLLQPVAPLLGLPEAELTYVAEAAPVLDAAQPIAISVNSRAGRSTAMWDFAALDRAFETFSPLLGQALDSAEHFNQASKEQIMLALSGESVYFRYGHALPAALPASWLDASLEAAVGQIHTCILSAADETLTLFLLGKADYAAVTAIPSEMLRTLLPLFEADGSQFAFETDLRLEALSLLPGSTPAVPSFTVSNPCDSRYINALATLLGFNPYGEGRYTDDLGTVRFSETNATLEITAAGLVAFRAEADRFTADTLQPQALAETARQWIDLVLTDVPGDGRLYLSGLTQSGNTTVCTFDYVISGIPVVMAGEAARVTFTGQSVSEAVIQVCSFTGTGKTIYPLPIAQAAAVLREGSALEMSYCINANDTLTAGWRQ